MYRAVPFFTSRLCLLAVGCLVTTAGSTSADQHNLLLIIADDMGVDQVGVYGEGSNPAKTPNIDALAAEGILFRNAWANPLCSPTRALIQTGRHSFRTGVVNSVMSVPWHTLSIQETTLPEVLGPAGYRCGFIGKWHLGEQLSTGGTCSPNMAGWPYFAGALAGGLADYYEWFRTVNCMKATHLQYATSTNVDDALAWIGRSSDRPWLCIVSFNAPHSPYHAPPRELHSVDLVGRVPESNPIPFFRAMIEAMDTEIGRLLAGLGDARANTTVVFTSDNGPVPRVVEPPFDSLRSKGTVYEGGVNVPLIVAGPQVVSPGREVSAVVGLVDLFATFAELAEVPATTGVDSISLVPYLIDANAPPQRSTIYCEVYADPIPDQRVPGQRAIRNARYKLIQHITRRISEEFYDLIEDPFETTDLLNGTLTQDQQKNYVQLKAALPDTRQQLRP